ncbi:MAG: DedA family protein [Candidatus Micrarchaeia archaeon]
MIDFFFSVFKGFQEWGVSTANGFMASFGGFGIALGMFLESSFVPIPSELVLVTAGALGFDPLTVALWGALGSTLGSVIGYGIGFWGGRPVVKRVGPYLLVTPERVERAEQKFARYGGVAILVARLIPFIPYKVFSIASGVLKFDLKQFVVFTFVGTLPRAFLLAWLGLVAARYASAFYVVAGLVAGVAMIVFALHRLRWFEAGAALLSRKAG